MKDGQDLNLKLGSMSSYILATVLNSDKQNLKENLMAGILNVIMGRGVTFTFVYVSSFTRSGNSLSIT